MIGNKVDERSLSSATEDRSRDRIGNVIVSMILIIAVGEEMIEKITRMRFGGAQPQSLLRQTRHGGDSRWQKIHTRQQSGKS